MRERFNERNVLTYIPKRLAPRTDDDVHSELQFGKNVHRHRHSVHEQRDGDVEAWDEVV